MSPETRARGGMLGEWRKERTDRQTVKLESDCVLIMLPQQAQTSECLLGTAQASVGRMPQYMTSLRL